MYDSGMKLLVALTLVLIMACTQNQGSSINPDHLSKQPNPVEIQPSNTPIQTPTIAATWTPEPTVGATPTVTVDESQVVDIELEPGEMSLHHVGLVHGSDPNTSPKDRIGFAIRYIATNVKQISGRTTATLARGVDEFSHFDLEPRPMREYDDSCRNFRNHALEKQQQILFAGVNQEPSSESHTLSNLS